MQPLAESHATFASARFPSLISSNNELPSAYIAAMSHLRKALGAIAELPVEDSAERQQEQKQLRELVGAALAVLHVFFGVSGDQPEGVPGEPGDSRFCERLRRHREKADLTQADLAQLSGLSLSLIRRLEQGSLSPSRGALLALCAVPELQLVPPGLSETGAGGSRALVPNWYVPPGFDSVQMLGELAQQLNSGSGSIEQTFAYLDHQSAADWIALCNEPDYVARFRERMPLDGLAQRIREAAGPVGLDVVALGPGDGRNEVRLVQHLLSGSTDPSVRLYLLDASQPLLSRAFRHAMDTFANRRSVFVCAIQGNFHHLPRYLQIGYTPQGSTASTASAAPRLSHRRRLYTLLGGTLGNLESEPQFFQNALAGAAPGDLLALDLLEAFGSPERPDELWQVDPTLRGELSPGYRRWLCGPILRYCPDVSTVKFSWRLDVDRPVPGSYGIETIADIAQAGGQRRSLSVCRIHRYDPAGLVQCLRRLGWGALADLPFTGESIRPARMLLFQRRGLSA